MTTNSYPLSGSILSFVIFLAFSLSSGGQTFQDINSGITAVGRSASEWCDYDQDGDLDLIISGLGIDEARQTVIYRNDAGDFVDIQAGLPGMKEASASWGDYDGDGDFDLVLAGNSESGDKTYIFRNDDGGFVDTDSGIPGIRNGDAQWGDYDNDGDLDLFITGNWMGKIFVNNNGVFTDSGQDFGYWASSSMDWGDYDNDGDLDIILIGDSGAGVVTMLFRNNSGIFEESGIQIDGLMSGTADLVDCDNDGDLDIAISGFNDALEARFVMYENQGNDTFEIFWAGIEGVALGSVDWGDFDNDGDLDMIMSGKATGCGAYVSGLYRNDGEYFYKLSTEFIIAQRGALNWADYDNDGDLDFVITGLSTSEYPLSKIYRNMDGMNVYQANTPPEVPAQIEHELNGNSVILRWDRASDDQTPVEGLYYNLRMGLTEDGSEIISCMSDLATGARRIISRGNMNQDTSWMIHNLEAGTYYYNVQTVDQGFLGSVFTVSGSFTITATGINNRTNDDLDAHIFPNPASDHIRVEINDEALIEIFNIHGQIVRSEDMPESGLISLDDLNPGMYFVRISAPGGNRTISLIKK